MLVYRRDKTSCQ